MKRIKKRFTPLGFDYITLACWNREFWGKRLEWLGFKRVEKQEDGDDPFGKNDYNAYWGSAFSLGRVRIFLVDPATIRLGKTYVEWFLKTRGNMQIIEIGIAVDSADEALQEFLERGIPLTYPVANTGDIFGRYRVTEITALLGWSFRCRIIERENREAFEYAYRKSLLSSSPDTLLQSDGIDHIAIAVKDLNFWVDMYKSLGFEVVYTPQGKERGLIEGKESAMKTYALRRGGWTIALVEGVDRARISQVTTYVDTHGDHSAHHAALLFPDLARVVGMLHAKGARFRLSRVPKEGEEVSLDHILHYGEDYSGQLFQCFTKPLDRKWKDHLDWFGRKGNGRGGFFFELTQRLSKAAKKRKNKKKQQFYSPTVRGLFESVEREEIEEDCGLVFPEESGYPNPIE